MTAPAHGRAARGKCGNSSNTGSSDGRRGRGCWRPSSRRGNRTGWRGTTSSSSRPPPSAKERASRRKTTWLAAPRPQKSEESFLDERQINLDNHLNLSGPFGPCPKSLQETPMSSSPGEAARLDSFAELLEAARGGDKEAQGRLLETCRRPLLRLA